jgi:hypothetical protein
MIRRATAGPRDARTAYGTSPGDSPHGPVARSPRFPFEPATEPGRLRKVSQPILRLIFDGTIAANPPGPGRSFAIGYCLRPLEMSM